MLPMQCAACLTMRMRMLLHHSSQLAVWLPLRQVWPYLNWLLLLLLNTARYFLRAHTHRLARICCTVMVAKASPRKCNLCCESCCRQTGTVLRPSLMPHRQMQLHCHHHCRSSQRRLLLRPLTQPGQCPPPSSSLHPSPGLLIPAGEQLQRSC